MIDEIFWEGISSIYIWYGVPRIHHEISDHEGDGGDEGEAGVEGVWGFHGKGNYEIKMIQYASYVYCIIFLFGGKWFLSNHKHPCHKLHNRGVEKEGKVESEGEVGSEGHLGIAVAIDGKEDDSDDTSTEVGEEESEHGDFGSGDETHEEGNAEVSATDPFSFGEDNLDVEEWENEDRSDRCVDDGDIEESIIEEEKMGKKGEWYAERSYEEEEKEENINGDEDFIRDFHEAEIIEDKDDGGERDKEEKPEP